MKKDTTLEKINALLKKIEQTQKQKGIAKYGDLDIRSRRSKEQLLIDILEELQDSMNYIRALNDISKTGMLVDIYQIMMHIAQEYVDMQELNNGDR